MVRPRSQPVLWVYPNKVKIPFTVLLVYMLAISAWAQTPAIPRFEDYPVTDVFKGKPIPPQIVTPLEHRYRTRIREGVEKGWGVFRDGKEQDTQGANFAGRYIIVRWGCGVPCVMVAIVDASTGVVYPPPLCSGHCGTETFALPFLLPGDVLIPSVAEIDFRLNSRLMIMQASPLLPAWRSGVSTMRASRNTRVVYR
jgi:hypothetical protein